MPASCEQCGKTELLEENREAWEFVCTFPGVLTSSGFSAVLRVDYGAVREIAAELKISNISELLIKLEAVASGYARK